MPSGGEEVDLEEAMKLFEGFLKDLKDLNVEEALASFGEPDPAKQGIGEVNHPNLCHVKGMLTVLVHVSSGYLRGC